MARIAGVDLPRNKRIEVGLTYIYGIGLPTAQKILETAGVNPDRRVQELNDDEVNRLRFERGAVGMPKAGKDTGGCQLFITLVPTPHLDGRYTVFGRVVAGMDAVDRLEPGDRIIKARVVHAVE